MFSSNFEDFLKEASGNTTLKLFFNINRDTQSSLYKVLDLEDSENLIAALEEYAEDSGNKKIIKFIDNLTSPNGYSKEIGLKIKNVYLGLYSKDGKHLALSAGGDYSEPKVLNSLDVKQDIVKVILDNISLADYYLK